MKKFIVFICCLSLNSLYLAFVLNAQSSKTRPITSNLSTGKDWSNHTTSSISSKGILDPEITISSDAPGNTLCYGTAVTFTATTSGTSATNYQWKKNGNAISGQTSSTYTTSDLVNGDAISVCLSEHSGAVVTANSVLHIDAGNLSSYTGSGTTWSDLSGNNNHITMTSSLAATYSSTIGLGSFHFQANGIFAIQSSAMNNWNLTTTDALTVETWIKRTNYGNHQFWFSTPDLFYRLGVDPSGNLFWDMAQYQDRSVSVNVSENTWHHIVYTAGKESGYITTRVYLDGSLVATQNEGITDLSPFTNYLIGDGQTPGWHPLNGYMGLMRIYNSTLSAADVLQNYNAEVDRFTNGGIVSNTLTMTVNNLPIITITSNVPTTLCSGSEVTLTAIGGGNCIEFNGSNKITFASTPTIPAGNSYYTIEAWVKPNSISDNGIVGWGNWGGGNQVNALRFNGSGQLKNYWWDNDLVVSIPNNALDGNWHHVAATFDGTTRSIYWDGELRGSDHPGGGHNVTTSSNMNIASTNNGEYFNGEIDEVRIWSVARTQQQIQDNMNIVVPENSTGLSAYYRLDEGTGTTASDETGHGNTGTLTNSPTWVNPSTAPISFPASADLEWSTGATTSSITVSTAGSYTVSATNGEGCTGSDNVSVTVNPLPEPALSGLTAVSSGQANVTYTTDAGMTNYNWTVSGNTSSTGGGASDNTITITWGASGTGHVKVNYTDMAGCTADELTDLPVFIIDKTSAQSGSWNEGSSWTPAGVPTINENIKVVHDITISDAPTALCNSLTIHSGSVTIDMNQALTVNTNLTNNSGATLTVESGGSLITNGTITNNGTINVKRSMADGRWHLVSAPVTGATAEPFTGKYLQSWSEPTHSFSQITLANTPLAPATGYLLWGNAPGKASHTTYTFTGTPLTGAQSKALTYTDNGSGNKGANLVGNPYPSSIDWDLLRVTYGAVYYLDNGEYIEWNGEGVGGGSRYISPLQGFFVVVNGNSTLNLSNAHRSHDNANLFYKQATASDVVVLETVSPDGYSDKLYMRFDPEALPNFELPRDAWKLPSFADGISQLWSVDPDGGRLSIDVRPATESVPVGFSNTANGTYSIGVAQWGNQPALFLEDTQTGTIHNFANGDYHFNYTLTDNPNRFKLLFGAIGTPETANATIRQWISGQTLYISAPTLAGQQVQVTVYSLTGQALQRQQVTLGEINAIALQGKQGAVVVETTTLDGSAVLTTKGIIIK